MLISEIINENYAWARTGKKIVKKYRCGFGKRAGRVVANPSKCFGPIDIKKKQQLKKTRARLKNKMSRKSRKTKRLNPVSRRVQQLNK